MSEHLDLHENHEEENSATEVYRYVTLVIEGRENHQGYEDSQLPSWLPGPIGDHITFAKHSRIPESKPHRQSGLSLNLERIQPHVYCQPNSQHG